MRTDTLAEHFREQLGERVLDARVNYGQLTVTVAPQALPQVARFCKEQLGMTFFDFLSAVDEREDGFTVVVRLYSHTSQQGAILKTLVPGGRDEPRLPTLTGVYAGADWHEREAYDMFGIVFEGHPGLLPRILTVENFEGWPLRKDFRLTSRDVKPWPGAKEPGGGDEDEAADKPAAAAPAPGADPGDRAAAAKAKAERAKAKAAEARKRKAAERAAAEDTTGPQATAGGSGGDPQKDTAAERGEPVPESVPEADSATQDAGDAPADDAEAGSTREAMAAAAGQPVPEGTPDPTEPEGAAEIAGTDAANDAAAGARDGDTATPAPGDPVEGDQPVDDRAGEASKGEGGDATDQQAPGVQPEGTHDLETSTARTDMSDEATPEDTASREAHGVGPGSTGTFADPQEPEQAPQGQSEVPADSDEETDDE